MTFPVLWLTGPPGVGKTAVGERLFASLAGSGIQTGFVDIDQLGMCYPEQPSDPGRHRLKARNLDLVIAGHRAAGARCVVVSGVTDPVAGVDADALSGVSLTVCRLRADSGVIARRLVGRQGHAGDLEVTSPDAGVGWSIDTTALTVAEVARQVREGWPVPSAPVVVDDRPGPSRAGPIVWLCGATGVGKSTVGFQVYLKTLAAGLTAAYVDLDQLGLCGPTPADHRLKARNATALWRTYRDAGAEAMVMVGPAEDRTTIRVYADALSPATLTVCRLHAGPATLRDRILRCGAHRSWSQPADPLVGQPAAHLSRVAERAAREAEALDRAALGHRIDTDGRTPDEVAALVLAHCPWSG